MNGLSGEQMSPQTFLYGCVLETGKEVLFNPEDDDFEHQLDLRMACADPATKDEFHLVEVEGQDSEGQKVTAALVSLKPSTLPSVCLGGFTITPPAVFRLKAGSGPIHISGQHLVMMEPDQSFDDDDDDDEEEEEEDVPVSKKRPAMSPVLKSQKKMKLDVDAGDEDEDSPVKAKKTPSKPPKSAQNGKGSKPNTPAPKQVKTPKGKGEKSPKAPATPKEPLTLPEIQTKMTEAMKKGVALPKNQPKFENFVKNSYKVSDAKVIEELWKWRQAVADPK
ncbi:nucleophosmin 1a [Dunckerocampus dactyliophorus]|uniref:nucleophosmin 1a n=1 Tax=Dunckerocampus dactyliophorus TaxID=161453 RepID=UPI00240532A0|nr:nucleophosmin 1a [Dunckerocampus dactyliophorus]